MTKAAALWAEGLVVTCEHASRALPAHLRPLFDGAAEALGGDPQDVLRSHRGFDPGAKRCAKALALAAGVQPILGTLSRLVVDLNRSVHHPKLFSPVTRALPKQTRQKLVQRYWLPHRERALQAVSDALATAPVCRHLAMHSFTPIWQGEHRQVDIGLLYQPQSAKERLLAAYLAQGLRQHLPGLRVRMNAPYRGASDGLPTALRAKWPQAKYVGIEIEVNQALVHNARAWHQTVRGLVHACQSGLSRFGHEHESF